MKNLYHNIFYFPFLFILLNTSTGYAQEEEPIDFKYINIGFGFQTGSPLEDFYHTAKHIIPVGVNGSINFHLPELDKIYFGIGFSYLNYGLESYTQDIESDGNFYEVEATRQYGIYFPYVNFRIMPWDHKIIVPVLDVFLGPRAFSTSSSYSYEKEPSFVLSLLGSETQTKYVRNSEFNDWSWSYGFEVGLNILIINSLQAEFKVGYIDGSEAKYLLKEDVNYDFTSETFTYTPRSSDSDMLTINFCLRYELF